MQSKNNKNGAYVCVFCKKFAIFLSVIKLFAICENGNDTGKNKIIGCEWEKAEL